MNEIIQRYLRIKRERERRRRDEYERMRMLMEEQDRRHREMQQRRFRALQLYHRNLLPERQPDTTPPDEIQTSKKHNWIEQGY